MNILYSNYYCLLSIISIQYVLVVLLVFNELVHDNNITFKSIIMIRALKDPLKHQINSKQVYELASLIINMKIYEQIGARAVSYSTNYISSQKGPGSITGFRLRLHIPGCCLSFYRIKPEILHDKNSAAFYFPFNRISKHLS